MIVNEAMLSRFRGSDGLCTLRRDVEQPRRYLEYAELFEQMQRLRPTIIDLGAVTLTDSAEVFKDVWSNSMHHHGTVTVLAFTKQVPRLPESRTWWALQHQGAGYACAQTAMIATRLAPRPYIQAAFDRIAADNHYACGGYFDSPDRDPDLTARYLAEVVALGLSCDGVALGQLHEGVYPVNATTETLTQVCEDVVDLLPLVGDKDASPLILFLSENSD